jgi:histidyl-tRNA synthetase
VAVDKLDKVGVEGVLREMEQRGLPSSAADQLPELVKLRALSSVDEVVAALSAHLADSETGKAALEGLKELLHRATASGVSAEALVLDPLLARGLDYYTGAIFEVTVEDAPVGSICGGGRYDDLTGIFGWSGMSGVGISFGADRIEDVLNHFNAWPMLSSDGLDVMVVQMDGGDVSREIEVSHRLRAEGLSVELYPDAAKLKKQFKHANDRGARWTVLIGEAELESGKLALKDMKGGEQWTLTLEEAVARIQEGTDAHE